MRRNICATAVVRKWRFRMVATICKSDLIKPIDFQYSLIYLAFVLLKNLNWRKPFFRRYVLIHNALLLSLRFVWFKV